MCRPLFGVLTTVPPCFQPADPTEKEMIYVKEWTSGNLHVGGRIITRKRPNKDGSVYGRCANYRSTGCRSSANYKDGLVKLYGDCICKGTVTIKVGDIVDINVEMKEFVKTRYHEFSRLAPKDAANKIHAMFTEKYAGQAFKGPSVDQLHSLVKNLRNHTGPAKSRHPSICPKNRCSRASLAGCRF